MLILNIGMPRSGTLWRYKLIRDLVIANGGKDGLEIRQKFLLHPFIGLPNADLNTTKFKRLFPATIPAILGNSYVLFTHDKPTPFAKAMLRSGIMKAIYGYRDPRDCILSILEYSQRAYPQYRAEFLEVTTVPEAVSYMETYMIAWKEWINLEGTLVIRYEDMLENFEIIIKQIVDYLGLNIPEEMLVDIKNNYLPRKKSEHERTHFVHGKTNRFRENFSEAERNYLLEHYSDYLKKMRYAP
jgi:hypothetical protein